jgi:hypothetical protein
MELFTKFELKRSPAQNTPVRSEAKLQGTCFISGVGCNANKLNKMNKKISRGIGTSIILLNIVFFIPGTILLIISGGGPFAYGLLLLPITFISHLFLFPAILTWTNKDKDQSGFIIFNSLGIIWMIFWIITYFINAN